MVVALGPGRFYGSSLPRPRYFSDVKFNEERVDPPVSVLDPLLSWAKEAHWSMGGLGFQRYRLQGRIEGSIKKLKVQSDRSDKMKNAAAKARVSGVKPVSLKSLDSDPVESVEENVVETTVVTTPQPPKKKRARKLIDEFEMVAAKETAPAHKRLARDLLKVDTPKKSSSSSDAAAVIVSPRTRSQKLPSGNNEITPMKINSDEDAVFVSPRTRSHKLPSGKRVKVSNDAVGVVSRRISPRRLIV